MKWSDLFEEAYRAITANKVRSGLTMLGIVIGIASVIALMAVGQGSQQSITSSIESTGANLLTVTAQLPAGRGAGQRRAGERSNAHARLTPKPSPNSPTSLPSPPRSMAGTR